MVDHGAPNQLQAHAGMEPTFILVTSNKFMPSRAGGNPSCGKIGHHNRPRNRLWKRPAMVPDSSKPWYRISCFQWGMKPAILQGDSDDLCEAACSYIYIYIHTYIYIYIRVCVYMHRDIVYLVIAYRDSTSCC